MLNKFDWKNYLNSGGNKIVKIFENILFTKNLSEKDLINYSKTIRNLIDDFCADDTRSKYIEKNLNQFIIEPLISDKPIYHPFDLNQEYSIKSGLKALHKSIKDSLKKEKIKTSDNNVLSNFLWDMEITTTTMSFIFPELFIPYYFQRNFNVFSFIVETFEINLDLTQIPLKRDFKKRFFYYEKICEALQNFRIENNLNVPELWAFLYDYASKQVGGLNYIKKDIPKPRSAFFIGGTPPDIFFYSPKKREYPDITFWQCSPDARPGDMILFYMMSPESKIDSIWRSVCEGFDDPFFWYYRCTYIQNPQKIPNDYFTIKNMKQDKVLGKLPIVRKNMQGVNGVEIPPSVYNYIIEKSNLTDVPKIQYPTLETSSKIKNEHDVEINLLEPLLKKLGWQKRDYTTQMMC